MIAMDSAALASSIFLVGRKRGVGGASVVGASVGGASVGGASVGGASVPLATNSKPEACPTGKPEACPTLIGSYEDEVQPELEQIVRERVETLWEMGIAGADLVIACVGAGLRAFTKYERVEYANGEEVPAEKFLAEVEGVVLDAMLTKLSGATGGNVSAVDSASRFYVLWRFVYKTAELDAGEAIVFANGTHIELDGPLGLSNGKDALVEKKKAKYRVRDFTERGKNDKLGLPDDSSKPAPLIDVLHRILWLMENSPRKLNEFLDEARPDRERLRVLAQALAGAALSGKSEEESAKLVSTTSAEQSALGKLLANWRSLVESRLASEEGMLSGKK
jgi:putative DNA methylase